jgi:hypothetical protein
MLNYPAVDVAIGLTFLFFILALVCSGINEAISSSLRWRAQDLERGIWELLRDPERAGEEATAALEGLKKHPLIKPMLYPQNKVGGEAAPVRQTKSGGLSTSSKTDFPSYIPSRTFAAALLGLEEAAVITKGVDVRKGMRKLGDSIEAIPSKPVQQALGALLTNAQGDAVAFRHSVEQWYDDHMEQRLRVVPQADPEGPVGPRLCARGHVECPRSADRETPVGRSKPARGNREPGPERNDPDDRWKESDRCARVASDPSGVAPGECASRPTRVPFLREAEHGLGAICEADRADPDYRCNQLRRPILVRHAQQARATP